MYTNSMVVDITIINVSLVNRYTLKSYFQITYCVEGIEDVGAKLAG